jgi:hypothetical protein
VREMLTLYKTTRFVAVFAAAMLLAGSFVSSARAMTLSLDAGGIAGTVPAVGFSLAAETGLTPGVTPITIYDSTTGAAGLQLSSPAQVSFTFLGIEADATNAFDVLGGEVFTGASAPGSSSTFGFAGGLLDFAFQSTIGGTAANGAIAAGISIAFADLGDGSFIALFNDGGTDADFDDFAVKIAVSAVPLPAAVWLFLSAILGLVSFTRIRRDQKVA